MGLFTCILFGVLAAFTTKAVMQAKGAANILTTVIVGLSAGAVSAILGWIVGYAPLNKFSLLSIAIAIALAAITMIFSSAIKRIKLPKAPQLDEHELQYFNK